MEIINNADNQNGNIQSIPQQPLFQPHSNLLVWSILVTIFCCMVAGIVAIVYSAQSNSYYTQFLSSSDQANRQTLYNESLRANKTAKTWIIISAVSGVIVLLLYLALITFTSLFSNFS